MKTDFLSPTPMSVDIHYDTPRSSHVTAGGAVTINYAPVNVWRGTLDFAPVADRAAGSNPLPDIAKFDKPTVGFFVDLLETNQVPSTDVTQADGSVDNVLDDPVWTDSPGTLNDSYRIELTQADYDANTVTAGSLISLRQDQFPGYVTARRVREVTADRYAHFHTPFPEEFYALLTNSQLQYCINRPHVRARFSESPQRWRKMPGFMYPTSVQWIEDTAQVVFGLRAASGIEGAPEGALVTQNGQVMSAELVRTIGGQLVGALLVFNENFLSRTRP